MFQVTGHRFSSRRGSSLLGVVVGSAVLAALIAGLGLLVSSSIRSRRTLTQSIDADLIRANMRALMSSPVASRNGLIAANGQVASIASALPIEIEELRISDGSQNLPFLEVGQLYGRELKLESIRIESATPDGVETVDGVDYDAHRIGLSIGFVRVDASNAPLKINASFRVLSDQSSHQIVYMGSGVSESPLKGEVFESSTIVLDNKNPWVPHSHNPGDAGYDPNIVLAQNLPVVDPIVADASYKFCALSGIYFEAYRPNPGTPAKWWNGPIDAIRYQLSQEPGGWRLVYRSHMQHTGGSGGDGPDFFRPLSIARFKVSCLK